MIILIITVIIYVLFFLALVLFAPPVMIQGNPNPTYAPIWSGRNLGHKALYALSGIVEIACSAGIIYGLIWNIWTEYHINHLNSIWIGLLLIGAGYAVYRFHTWIYGVWDKLFG